MTIDGWVLMSLIVAAVTYCFSGGWREPEEAKVESHKEIT